MKKKEIEKAIKDIHWSPVPAAFQLSKPDKKWGRHTRIDNISDEKWKRIDFEVTRAWGLRRVGKDFNWVYYH